MKRPAGSPPLSPQVFEPSKTFPRQLLAWYQKKGRHDLPWQQPRTPYRVWVSEVMLQQTQVQTVIPYFLRFMARFPDVASLAQASLDEVLTLWQGLGYYRRAKHLHQAAQKLIQNHAGIFPSELESLCHLPGIGRSTAAAIRSLAFQEPAAIFDGNVRRVMLRYYGWSSEQVMRPATWWHFLERHLPGPKHAADYTQALMDLGALVCVPKQPQCVSCPLRKTCRSAHRVEAPPPRRATTLPKVTLTWMCLFDPKAQAVLMRRREAQGIWPGLYVFPEWDSAFQARLNTLSRHLLWKETQSIQHRLTHRQLDITIHRAILSGAVHKMHGIGEGEVWVPLKRLDEIPCPKPVFSYLTGFKQGETVDDIL